MTYREFAEHAKKLARNMRQGFTEPGDDWDPHFIVDLPGTTRPYLGRLPMEAFRNDATKDALVESLKLVSHEMRARKLALIISIWMTRLDIREPEDERAAREAMDRGEYPGGRPSQHPDRREYVMVTVYDSERTELWMAEIKRHRNRPPTLDAWFAHRPEDGSIEGRFAEIQEALA